MTCRDEILACVAMLEKRTADGTFSPDEVVSLMRQRGSQYPDTTIRTHVTSRLCANAPVNHGTVHPDLERIERGRYRRLRG